MRRRKYKAAQIAAAQRRVEVARLYNLLTREKHAAPQREIATRLKVSNATVCQDLKALEIEWRETRVDEISKQKTAMLKRLERIEAEAWTEWDRSKLDAQQTVVEQDVIEQGGKQTPTGTATVKRTTKGQTGDHAYLETLRGVEADRRKLLGLDAPTKQEVTAEGGAPLKVIVEYVGRGIDGGVSA